MTGRSRLLFGAAAVTTMALGFAAVSTYQDRAQLREMQRQLEHGQALANQFCTACHLATDPSILPKQSWEAALGYMGYWLGMENIDYLEDDPEFAQGNVASRHVVLARENVLPGSPALTEDDWASIRNYFIASAPEEALPQPDKPELNWRLPQFEIIAKDAPGDTAVTTLIRIREETSEIYLGNALTQKLSVLDENGNDVMPSISATPPFSPVDIEFIDDTVYVGSIGDLLATQPSNERPAHIASAQLVDNSLAGAEFEVLIDNLFRMADFNVLDLNDDSIVDFIVSGFGAVFGNVSLQESQPDGSHAEVPLVALPGAVKTEPHDFNDDGLLDIMVLLSDAREGLHILENQGENEFEMHTIFQTHPAYGHTYFELQDFNDDGAIDVLVVNGDNVDSDPYNTNKNYHGLRIYLNRGGYVFEEAYFYPMYGAFVAKAADFDDDGDLDIATTSFYPDFSSQSRESFTYLENTGDLTFTPYTNGQVMFGRWMTMDIGDVDGDDDVDVVLGGGYIPAGMLQHMDVYDEFIVSAPSVLILKNTLR
ncbi:MAG: FG-GAP repeat domain-containing protein [Candidatus Rariloculaceae bacterium]